MTKLNEIYKCEICGNTVEMMIPGAGEMVCCGSPMVLMLEKEMADVGTEKHKPVIEKTVDGITVKVGSIPHPMEEAHHIVWIEAIYKTGEVSRFNLEVGQAPQAKFWGSDIVKVRAYCNIHGLWATKL